MNKPTLYISGAISGMPELNKPKFAEATKKLRGMGYIVINPHEICSGIPAEEWEKCMKVCISSLMIADVIILLDDWKHSRGAKIELDVAVKIGMDSFDYHDFIELQERIKTDYGCCYDDYKDEINVFGGVTKELATKIRNEFSCMYFHPIGAHHKPKYWILSSLVND
ncbi:MAG: DUF4406 domain-containing protein [Sphingobacteriales bacterium]|nr:MAG: DUF4406 domain-containing protein [Sphingobacteriales bacterium]